MTIQGNRWDSRPPEKWTSPKCPHTGTDKASETQDEAQSSTKHEKDGSRSQSKRKDYSNPGSQRP